MSAATKTTQAIKDTELRAAVGPRADYYLARWKRSKREGLNLAAFVIPLFWLPYRKMHRATATLLGLLLLESVAETLVQFSNVMTPETPPRLQVALTIAICWSCGAFGNRWYRSHTERLIAAAESREPNASERLKLLAANGGTSRRLVALWLLAFLIANAAISYILERFLGYPAGSG